MESLKTILLCLNRVAPDNRNCNGRIIHYYCLAMGHLKAPINDIIANRVDDDDNYLAAVTPDIFHKSEYKEPKHLKYRANIRLLMMSITQRYPTIDITDIRFNNKQGHDVPLGVATDCAGVMNFNNNKRLHISEIMHTLGWQRPAIVHNITPNSKPLMWCDFTERNPQYIVTWCPIEDVKLIRMIFIDNNRALNATDNTDISMHDYEYLIDREVANRLLAIHKASATKLRITRSAYRDLFDNPAPLIDSVYNNNFTLATNINSMMSQIRSMHNLPMGSMLSSPIRKRRTPRQHRRYIHGRY